MLEPGDSAASHFFAIQELLLLVLDYISPPKATIQSSDRNSLAALARVSRNISGAALDALWRSIYQPGPSKILERGCELLPYIKAFRDPILPALAEFHWEPSVGDGSICAFHLLSRQAFIPSDKLTLVMWSEIEHSNAESDVLADTINAFNDPALPWLPDVKRCSSAPSTISPHQGRSPTSKLAAIPHLRFLDLRSILGDVPADILPALSFPALDSLRLHGTQSSVRALLPLISSPVLFDVHLHPKDFQTTEPDLFALLLPPTVPSRHSMLTHFTFSGLYGLSPHVRTLELAAFAPLHVCRALQTFCVDVVMDELVFTDADSARWPVRGPRSPCSSLHPGLGPASRAPCAPVYAVGACRGLPAPAAAPVAVDADVTDAFRVEDATGSCETMEELQLLYSPCGKPEIVAAFLNAAFPSCLRMGSTHQRPGIDRRTRQMGDGETQFAGHCISSAR
ncbi:hypothetical protein B0H10DRAFT_1937818 [Mycena sp. CBHHK59/15]|nr:hypothetical protein B0H10DRAFT_1937818 [Mycena sp. CBHHK59/15]